MPNLMLPACGGCQQRVVRRVLSWIDPNQGSGDRAVADRGMFFINSESKPLATIEFFSFATTRVTRIATIEKEPINHGLEPGDFS